MVYLTLVGVLLCSPSYALDCPSSDFVKSETSMDCEACNGGKAALVMCTCNKAMTGSEPGCSVDSAAVQFTSYFKADQNKESTKQAFLGAASTLWEDYIHKRQAGVDNAARLYLREFRAREEERRLGNSMQLATSHQQNVPRVGRMTSGSFSLLRRRAAPPPPPTRVPTRNPTRNKRKKGKKHPRNPTRTPTKKPTENLQSSASCWTQIRANQHLKGILPPFRTPCGHSQAIQKFDSFDNTHRLSVLIKQSIKDKFAAASPKCNTVKVTCESSKTGRTMFPAKCPRLSRAQGCHYMNKPTHDETWNKINLEW